jgi:hypothetical protein
VPESAERGALARPASRWPSHHRRPGHHQDRAGHHRGPGGHAQQQNRGHRAKRQGHRDPRVISLITTRRCARAASAGPGQPGVVKDDRHRQRHQRLERRAQQRLRVDVGGKRPSDEAGRRQDDDRGHPQLAREHLRTRRKHGDQAHPEQDLVCRHRKPAVPRSARTASPPTATITGQDLSPAHPFRVRHPARPPADMINRHTTQGRAPVSAMEPAGRRKQNSACP